MNTSKVMSRVDLSAFNAETDKICQDPIVVISHIGSLTSGHYIAYSKVGEEWYLNNDSREVYRVDSPFNHSSSFNETADIIVFKNT